MNAYEIQSKFDKLQETIIAHELAINGLRLERDKTRATIAQLQVENEALIENINNVVKATIAHTIEACIKIDTELHRDLVDAGIMMRDMDVIVEKVHNDLGDE